VQRECRRAIASPKSGCSRHNRANFNFQVLRWWRPLRAEPPRWHYEQMRATRVVLIPFAPFPASAAHLFALQPAPAPSLLHSTGLESHKRLLPRTRHPCNNGSLCCTSVRHAWIGANAWRGNGRPARSTPACCGSNGQHAAPRCAAAAASTAGDIIQRRPGPPVCWVEHRSLGARQRRAAAGAPACPAAPGQRAGGSHGGGTSGSSPGSLGRGGRKHTGA
jgi:hypothetical protein